MDWGLLDHSERRVFKIPVGHISKEEAEKLIRKLTRLYDYDKFLLQERKLKLDKIINKINEK